MRTPHGYTDTPMDMRNCVFRDTSDSNFHLQKHTVVDFMRPVIEAISRKRPSWWFVDVRNGSFSDNMRYHTAFDVVTDDGETLGSIWRDWRGDGHVYAINNKRLQETRRRGHATMTVKPTEAVKIITKTFYPTTPVELLNAARKAATNFAQGHHTAAYLDHHRVLRDIHNVVNSWLQKPGSADEIVKLVAMTPDTETKLRNLPELARADNETAAFANLTTTTGHTVLLRGGEYYVSTTTVDGNLEPVKYTEETLSDHIKGNMGLLKLLEPKAVVVGVGVRVDDNTFWVPAKEDVT